MNRKILVGILVCAVILFGVVMSFFISNIVNSAKNTSGRGIVDDADAGYFGSVGGERLAASDSDHTAFSAAGFDVYSVVAADDLGRTLSTDGQGDNGRQVALFYNLNHMGDDGSDIFQTSLDAGRQLIYAKSYWWGKPFFGFYRTDDTWVLRRHIEMFIYAGVDYLVFDTTNAHAYTENALKLMRLLHEYNEAGWRAPKVVFYTNTDSLNTIMAAYNDIYALNKYPDTWYMVDGKPLVIGAGVSSFVREFFTVRASQWPNSELVPGGYPWIDFKDVASIYYDENGKHGVVPVSVAQNCSPDALFSDNVLYGMTGREGGSRGRSWHGGDDNITEDSYKYGYNFQEEWDHAIASDAETAMVLQWNEWTAGVWASGGKLFIYDEMTLEYSRDIEPMTGGHFDNYYMQLCQNIRRFKNVGSRTVTQKDVTVDIGGGFSQWQKVGTVYADMAGITERRDCLSSAKERLTDATGRNNMVLAKVAKDAANLYFYVQTASDISTDTAGTWMNLYLDTNGDLTDHWHGYEYRVNGIASPGCLRLEKYNGSGFEPVAEIPYRCRGNQLMLSIPKAELGLAGDSYSVNFKWADSATELVTVEDFYAHGDTMPYGRFNYAFNAGK